VDPTLGRIVFEQGVEDVGKVVDGVGIAIVVVGSGVALLLFLVRLVSRSGAGEAYATFRRNLGRAILLGLEFLVAGDIIRTVATSPTFEKVAVLGIIVLIRTFLSFALQLEVEGRWPWERPTGATQERNP
jgi:uncharacterized membrane protein